MAIDRISNPGIISDVGNSLRTGISGTLQALAQGKLQQLHQRQATQRWQQAIPNIPAGLAQLIATAPPELQKSLLDRLEGLEFGGSAPQQGMQNFQQQFGPQESTQELQAMQQGAQQQGIKPVTLGANSAERRHRETLAQQKELADRKARAELFKSSKPERKEAYELGRVAEKQLKDLGRFEELEQEGLSTPGYVEFLKRAGYDIPALMNATDEEFGKIAANFIGGAATALGGRVTNFELEQFLKTIPSLSQSPEGRKRVIANLKYLKRSEVEYSNAFKEAIRRNKGVPPEDLLEQVDDIVGSKMDKLAEKFKKDLARPVSKGQNKYITALQAIAGEAVGAIPGAVKGAAKGAIAGSVLPGLGTTTGAILGGLGGATKLF